MLYVRSKNVIQRYHKPSNNLVNKNYHLKICSLRLANGSENKEKDGKFEIKLLDLFKNCQFLA